MKKEYLENGFMIDDEGNIKSLPEDLFDVPTKEREEMMKLLPTNVETIFEGISNFSILENGNYWPISETTYDKIQKLKELIKSKEK